MRAEGARKNLSIGKNNRTFKNDLGKKNGTAWRIYPSGNMMQKILNNKTSKSTPLGLKTISVFFLVKVSLRGRRKYG